jgi:hypothetical protein
MIGRMFHAIIAAVLYFSLATLIAEAILVSQLWTKWKMDRTKLVQMAAVAQGVDILSTREPSGRSRSGVSEEQPSYEQILAARAAKDLNLQLREQSMDNAMAALRSEQQQLAQSQQQYADQREQYQAQLNTLQGDAVTAGRDNVRRVLESVKAKQAKDLLMQMLRNNETEAVVMLLRDMPDSKRAKVVGEFKAPDEASKIEEILRKIREGTPEAELAQKANQQLQGKQPSQP